MSVTFIAAARRFKSPKRRTRRCARVAVDGTGLSHNAASTFLIRHGAAAARDDALELLAEVVSRHGSGQSGDSGAARTAGSVVRLPQSTGFGRCGLRSLAD